jgi:cell division protein FtsB
MMANEAENLRRINNLEAQNQTMSNEVAALKTEVAQLKSTVASLTATVNGLIQAP